MLKIYHAKHTRGMRVIWTAEEIGIPYELKHLPFNPAALKLLQLKAADGSVVSSNHTSFCTSSFLAASRVSTTLSCTGASYCRRVACVTV